MILIPNSDSIVESNDCHIPAGSPAGGQFCGSGKGTARKGGVNNPPKRKKDKVYGGSTIRPMSISGLKKLRDQR